MTTDNPYLPAPARGDGAETFSAPELFYLANQKLIDEWAALSSRASSVVSEWLRDVVGADLEALAEECAMEHEYVRTGKWRSSLLVVPGTAVANDRSVVGVGVGWSSNDVGQIGARRGGRPYVGINVDVTTALGKRTREALLAGDGRRLRDSNHYSGDQPWPVYRYIALDGDWWTALDNTRQHVRQEVSTLVQLFGDRLRAAAQLRAE